MNMRTFQMGATTQTADGCWYTLTSYNFSNGKETWTGSSSGSRDQSWDEEGQPVSGFTGKRVVGEVVVHPPTKLVAHDPCIFGACVPGDTPIKTKKPPLGLRPPETWVYDRRREIEAAVERYEEAGLLIPEAWRIELSNLTPPDGYDIRIVVRATSLSRTRF